MKTPHQSKHNWPNLIWQPLAAILFLWVVLICLDQLATSQILWAVGAGSLASSSYIVFGKPHGPTAIPLRIIGGYLVGIATGGLMRLASVYVFPVFAGTMFNVHPQAMQLVGVAAALSVGLSLFFMVLLRLEHPPAAGMALVLVLDVRDYYVVYVVIIAAIILALLRMLLRRYLQDLV